MVSDAATTARVGERNVSLDLLKLAMAAMVVGLHGGFLEDEAPVLSHFLTEGLFRIAVPTFFIINGFYLERQLATKGARWFLRVATIFAVWTMIYSVFWFDWGTFTLRVRARDVIPGYYHLWYLFALLGGATVFLVFRRVTSATSALLTAALLMFVTGLVIQYAGNWNLVEDPWWNQKLNGAIAYRNFLFFGFPFLTIGALIARHKARLTDEVRGLWVLLPLAFIALTAEWGLNYYLNEPAEFDIYASLLLVCPMLFLAVARTSVPGTGKTLALVAVCIYLMHPMIQMLLDRCWDVTGTMRTLISLAISAALAPAIIALNRRAPLL